MRAVPARCKQAVAPSAERSIDAAEVPWAVIPVVQVARELAVPEHLPPVLQSQERAQVSPPLPDAQPPASQLLAPLQPERAQLSRQPVQALELLPSPALVFPRVLLPA
jgi:hypothetical protein